MSGSAALEYGFPSTHSTNAVSVAVYCLYVLNSRASEFSPTATVLLQAAAYFYGFSIVLGRLYCGMHGFLDVICGAILGGALAAIQCIYGDAYDDHLYDGSLKYVLFVTLIILVLVRVHPEPVDDCPCFDDSVAFAGVMIGTEFGSWHYSWSGYALSETTRATVPFNLESMGWPVTITRIVVGVFTIFAWRGIMKPTLLRLLPPVFRIIERHGLTHARRFFKQASEYQRVPHQPHDDNILPAVSEIPGMLTSLRRRRAVSIGPQSEADAYETMAYREKRRRDSMSSLPSPVADSPSPTAEKTPSYVNGMAANGVSPKSNVLSGNSNAGIMQENNLSRSSFPNQPMAITEENTKSDVLVNSPAEDNSDLFQNLTRPRVRYDVEVVTKLVVYSGQSTQHSG